jgi:hypothetical protein
MKAVFGCFMLILTFVSITAKAQVEHNYLVGPQNTSCDSLMLNSLTKEEAVKAIENTVFRFDQKFRISRTSGVRAGHFYSCDGMMGYLILTVNQKKIIYLEVPKTVWDEFISNPDLDGYYTGNIQNNYQVLENEQ